MIYSKTKRYVGLSFLGPSGQNTTLIMDEQLYVKECDKILISDMLFYMQNKLQSIANDDIVKICGDFYTEDCIRNEKVRFFLAIGKKSITM